MECELYINKYFILKNAHRSNISQIILEGLLKPLSPSRDVEGVKTQGQQHLPCRNKNHHPIFFVLQLILFQFPPPQLPSLCVLDFKSIKSHDHRF